jgi:acyl-CoA synthetase (AMP-forming)/AMP-acid ligase II
VPWHVIEKLHHVLAPDADVHTPYGATEALPVSSIAGRELVGGCTDQSRRGAGTCVGQTLSDIDMRLIRITDGPIAEWSDELAVPDGELGEITVSGPVVTKRYFGLPHADELAKIPDGDRTWHRMGDVGYRDSQGRVWFCGRKAHRVQSKSGTLFSVRCEAVFNEHGYVARSALVDVGPAGRARPVIIVEPKPGRFPRRRRAVEFRNILLRLARMTEFTRGVEDVLFHRSLPVDVRHNAKIDREALAIWAARQLR